MMNFKKNRQVDRAIQRLKQTHKSYKSLGLIKFITHALYIKQETLLLLKNLDELSPYESLQSLAIASVDKENKVDLIEFYRSANISIGSPETLIDNYLDDGCKCFIAIKNEKLIGFLWWGDKPSDVKHCLPILRYIHKKILKKNDDALGIDFFILPAERGGGAALEFYAKACRKLNHLGYKHIFGTVLSDNRPARWTYNLLGLTVINKITIHRLLIYKTFIRTTDI